MLDDARSICEAFMLGQCETRYVGVRGGPGAFYARHSRDDLTRLAVPEGLSAVPGDSVIQGCVVAAYGYFCAALGRGARDHPQDH